MKKIFVTMLLSMMTFVGLMAQMNIWHNGEIIYQRDYTLIDSITFTIQDSTPSYDPELADGMYIVGAATAVANLNAANRDLARMAQGMNEVVKEYRWGMYEKYIALEANQPFQIIFHQIGWHDVTYGANLIASDVESDRGTIDGYRGNLVQDAFMQVPQSGLYHVVVDLNLDEQLPAAQVVIVPCLWGVRGDMNDWYHTAMTPSEFNKTQMTFTITNVAMELAGQFKFSHGFYWKFNLSEEVKAETTLGSDAYDDGDEYTKIVAAGRNFPITRGVHDITLTWELKGGDMGASFTLVDTKTADIFFDPTAAVVGISGTLNLWQDPYGAMRAVYNPEKSTVTNPANGAGSYVYELTAISFWEGAGLCDFRLNNYWYAYDDMASITGVEVSENEGGAIDVPAGTYDIEITVNVDENGITLSAAFTDVSSSLVYQDISISAIVPAGWTQCYLWAWNADGNIFEAWPGLELPISNGQVTYDFTQVVTPLNVIFSNGNGVQTIDINNVQNGDVIDIQSNLQ